MIKDDPKLLKPDKIAWKPNNNLTIKQNNFIKHLVEYPRLSATKAVKAVYNTTSENTASQIASENLRKPQIMLELSKYSNKAELVLIEVMNYSLEYGKDKDNRNGSNYANTAVTVANSLLDRLHGKAQQTISTTSQSVVLSIDLTGTVEQSGDTAKK